MQQVTKYSTAASVEQAQVAAAAAVVADDDDVVVVVAAAAGTFVAVATDSADV